MADRYDLLIIGAGPGGLTAAIYGARAGLRTGVLDPNPAGGGQIQTSYEVDNYPGLPGISGMELGMKMKDQAVSLGAEFLQNKVSAISGEKGNFHLETDHGILDASEVILAMGASPRKMGIPGEDKLRGRGVSYCATCDGAFFRKKNVAVVGGGDTALSDALFLSRFGGQVSIVHRRDEFRGAKALQEKALESPALNPVMSTIPREVVGEDHVEGLKVSAPDGSNERTLPVSGIFVAVGTTPNTGEIRGLPKTNEKGYLIAGEDGRTSIPGIYAVGDIRTKALRQVVTAAADGANAVNSILEDRNS